MLWQGSMVEGSSVAWWKGMGRVWQIWVHIPVRPLLAVWLWVVFSSLLAGFFLFPTIRVVLLLQSVLWDDTSLYLFDTNKCAEFDSCSWRCVSVCVGACAGREKERAFIQICIFWVLIQHCLFPNSVTHWTNPPLVVAMCKVPGQDSVPLSDISWGVGAESVW